MTTVRYVGPHDEVTFDFPPGSCKRGDTIDVTPDLAAQLVLQNSWKAPQALGGYIPPVVGQPPPVVIEATPVEPTPEES